MKFIVGMGSTVSFGSGTHNLPGSSFAFLVDSLKLRSACLELNVVSTQQSCRVCGRRAQYLDIVIQFGDLGIEVTYALLRLFGKNRRRKIVVSFLSTVKESFNLKDRQQQSAFVINFYYNGVTYWLAISLICKAFGAWAGKSFAVFTVAFTSFSMASSVVRDSVVAAGGVVGVIPRDSPG